MLCAINSPSCDWFFIFFLMIRRPPRSTLFPTRRSSDLGGLAGVRQRRAADRRDRTAPRARSEEHTSELQSQSNLVCRLLLEKKKSAPRAIAAGARSPTGT